MGRLPWFIRLPFKATVFAVLSGGAALLVTAFIYSAIARGFDLGKLGQMPERSVVLDRHGVVLGRLHGENRTVVPLGEVSPYFRDALLAREDRRFYQHYGVDLIGVGRAVVRNAKERSFVQGASTITMQLARNSFGIFDKSLHRKMTEVFIALRIERKLTKGEILEAYMNRIFYGTGLYGIERATQAYFGKPARELTLGEAAMLAGIIRGPNRFSPFRSIDRALRERDDVLDAMVAQGKVPAGAAAAAKREETTVLAPPEMTLEASYALDAVRRDLNVILDDEDVEDGGLKIITTLDANLQSVAEAALNRRLREVEKRPGYPHQTKAQFDAVIEGKGRRAGEPRYLQGALLVIDNQTGGFRAVVGGRDMRHSQFNRALSARREVGSTFKPFVYTAAFQNGLFPGTLMNDNPIEPGELNTQDGDWSPANSDGKYIGLQPASVGLVRSRNTMSVRVGDYAGVDNVVALAKKAGFGEITSRSPQLFIGNLAATPESLTSAFTIFANNGLRKRPFVIERIEDREGDIIYQSGEIGYPVVEPGMSAMVAGLLEQTFEPGGTAASARELGYKKRAGGKTGTTNDYHDAWFVGFNGRLTCGVWVGLDKPQRIVNRGYGGTLALPVWVDLMKFAEEKGGYKDDLPKARPLLTEIELCRVSGHLATEGCRASRDAYVAAVPPGRVPRGFCPIHRGRPAGTAPVAGRAQREPTLFDRIRSWFR